MTEHAGHYWRQGLESLDLLATVDYHQHALYDKGFSSNTNITTGAPRLTFGEIVFDMEVPPGTSERCSMVHPEQRPISLMAHLLKTFSQLGGTVLYFCVGTESTAKACLLAPKYFKFVGYDVDSACITKTKSSILKIFAQQVLDDESNIDESEEIQVVAKHYLQRSATAAEYCCKKVWKCSRGLCAI